MDLIRNQFFIGFCINFILIYIFCRIPLMTKSGWVSAGFLGTILWGCLSWQGWMSVVIYLLFGSLVTKIGFKFKKEQGIAEKRGGRRGPENVWGSAATGLFFAIMTKSGWISAGILGTILWGCLSWQGWMSVVIYLLFGSLVTKIGFKFKKAQGIAEKRGGRRGPENVWGSAATGLFLAIMAKFNATNVVMFKVGFAASFAAKLADTFGSEIWP
jgi:uncharacterized membrane protein